MQNIPIPKNPLFLACYKGKVEEVLKLSENYPLNEKDENGDTALHICAQMRKAECTDILIKRGNSVNILGNCDMTPIFYACFNNDTKMIDVLLPHTDPKTLDVKDSVYGFTPFNLISTNEKCEAQTLKKLIDAGSKMETRNGHGHFPLKNLVLLKNYPCIKLLMEEGCDYNMIDMNKRTCQEVCENIGDRICSLFLFELILKRGIIFEIVEKTFAEEELKSRLTGYYNKVTNRQIEPISPNIKNEDGLTPLHVACLKGKIEIVRILLDKGADPNILDRSVNRRTPLFLSVKKREITKLLLSYGAKINQKHPENLNALMWACILGEAKDVQLLLDRGADPNLQCSESGYTALMYAILFGDEKREMIEALVKDKNVRHDVRDKKGRTALQVAHSKSFEWSGFYIEKCLQNGIFLEGAGEVLQEISLIKKD